MSKEKSSGPDDSSRRRENPGEISGNGNGPTVLCLVIGGVCLLSGGFNEAAVLLAPLAGFEKQAHDFLEARNWSLAGTGLGITGAGLGYLWKNIQGL